MNLSIVIPTCDRPKSVNRAISSVWENGGKSCEIVVVDDGTQTPFHSEFDSEAIQIVRTSGRTGASAARNLGVRTATGDFILFLDDDDVFQHHYVELVLRHILEKKHKVGACNTSKKMFVTADSVVDKTTKLKRSLFGAGMGFWIERELFLNLNGFDESLHIDEDTDLCVRIRAHNIPIFVSKCIGVEISPQDGDRNDKARLTHSTSNQSAAACYVKTANKNISSPALSFFDKFYLVSRSARKFSKTSSSARQGGLQKGCTIWKLLFKFLVSLHRIGKIKPS